MKRFTVRKGEIWRNTDKYYTNGHWLMSITRFNELFKSNAKRLKEFKTSFSGVDESLINLKGDEYLSDQEGYTKVTISLIEELDKNYTEITFSNNLKVKIQSRYLQFLLKDCKEFKVKDTLSPIKSANNDRALMPCRY